MDDREEMAPRYDHKLVEEKIYRMWEEGGYFKPEINPKGKPYTIILPPPNANADLHLGHALFTIEDVLIRYHRMRGEAALWLPGFDHAGIETQFVFEKELKKQGKSRFDFDNETFYQMIWDFVAKNKDNVRSQLKKLGFSLDWSREKFSLDPEIVKIVYATFNKLRKDNLVYRGERIVNYCTKCGTAFSDLEINYVERKDRLFYLKYGPFVLATTRPETKFGDTAVAFYPGDKRYEKYLNKEIEILGVNGNFKVKVVADEAIDPNFGTGIEKVTPAHDALDFEISQRHHLPIKRVIEPNGRLNELAGRFAGMKVAEAREAVYQEMIKMNLIDHVDENYIHNIATCYKCATTIEPMVILQWFIKMKPLAKKAIEAVKNGRIKIFPERFEKTFFRWLDNIRDWNISRQIVWGIKIPIKGETDTFDTWFSSGQWPFATLRASPFADDFKKFYPTTVMETGYDILFFWVARMMMLGIYATGQIPFETVYLHGLVRDMNGQKMSKSKGNVINPLEMAEKYGADAVRFSLIVNVGPGQDQRLSEDKIRSYRNFSNKLWNIGRFLLETEHNKDSGPGQNDKELEEKINNLIKTTTKNLDSFHFGNASDDLYQFTWHEFADKYIEDYKQSLRLDAAKKGLVSYSVLLNSFVILLRLLHPFIPFVTEEIWGKIPKQLDRPLIIAPWPN